MYMGLLIIIFSGIKGTQLRSSKQLNGQGGATEFSLSREMSLISPTPLWLRFQTGIYVTGFHRTRPHDIVEICT